MRWRRAIKPEAWRNLALEANLTVRSRGLPPLVADPHWTLDPASLDGLVLRWPRVTLPAICGRLLAPVRRAMSRHIRLELADIHQPVSSVVLTELLDGKRTHLVAIDLHDFSTFRDEALVRSSLVYFKMQHRRGSYGIPQVVPGGYVTNKETIYRYLP